MKTETKTGSRVRVLVALVGLTLLPAVRAQATWRPLPELTSRSGHAMAYDPVRDRVVMFGGAYGSDDMGDTWEWDGKGWELRRPLASPGRRFASRMAFDPVRKTVLLFGGWTADKRNNKRVWHSDTWEWDGSNWSRLSPATSPLRRQSQGMATDWARSRIVLFGGFTDVGAWLWPRPLSDTWEWDGKNWTQRFPRTVPPARGTQAFAFHVRTGRIAMFGGHNNGSNGFTDTWEWDGKDWISFSPKNSAPTAYSRMVSDPFTGTTLLYSGGVDTAIKAGTWRWDGQNWTNLGQTLTPASRVGFGLAPDPVRRQVILFGGAGPGHKPRPWHETFGWDGKAWKQVHDSPFPGEIASIVVHDGARDEFLVLEPNAKGWGPAQTWVMHDGVFRRLQPATAPPFLNSTRALLYHPGLGKVFYRYGDGQRKEIWLWDGKQWTKTSYQKGPDGWDAHLAWDGHRQKMVEYDPRTGDLWEWDPSGWTRMAATSRPPRRRNTAFGYDPLRRRLVLYGGSPGWPYLDDTWEWDGTRWLRMSPKTRPLARIGAGMAYVPALGGMVLFGGQGVVPPGIHQPLADTWLWDGKDWTKLAVPPLPTVGLLNRTFPLVSATYDAGRQRLVAFYYFAHNIKPAKSMWEFLFESLKSTQPYPRPGERFQLRIHLPGQAGQVFLLLLAGAARPGIPLRRVRGLGVELLPLSPDPLFWVSLGSLMLTRLDAKGNAAIPLAIPKDSALLWLRFHAAGATLHPMLGVGAITNDVPLQIVK